MWTHIYSVWKHTRSILQQKMFLDSPTMLGKQMPRKKRNKQSAIPDQNNYWTMCIFPSLCPLLEKLLFIKADSLKNRRTHIWYLASVQTEGKHRYIPTSWHADHHHTLFPAHSTACRGLSQSQGSVTALRLLKQKQPLSSGADKWLCWPLWSLPSTGTAGIMHSLIQGTPGPLGVAVEHKSLPLRSWQGSVGSSWAWAVTDLLARALQGSVCLCPHPHSHLPAGFFLSCHLHTHLGHIHLYREENCSTQDNRDEHV